MSRRGDKYSKANCAKTGCYFIWSNYDIEHGAVGYCNGWVCRRNDKTSPVHDLRTVGNRHNIAPGIPSVTVLTFIYYNKFYIHRVYNIHLYIMSCGFKNAIVENVPNSTTRIIAQRYSDILNKTRDNVPIDVTCICIPFYSFVIITLVTYVCIVYIYTYSSRIRYA